MAKTKEEAYTINQEDSAITAADGTANTWSDIWKYQVPTGHAHILKPSHHFAAYLWETTNDAEVGDGTCRVKIEIRDQSEADSQTIYGPALYVASKEFQDRDKMATLSLQQDIVVEEKFYIVVMAYDDGAIDESGGTYECYFKLETIRIRSSI